MTQRKPNNLPWIILGGVCGLAVLGLFGFGVYSGAKSVSDEVTVTMPEVPVHSEQSDDKNKLSIYVNAENQISFEGKDFADANALKETLQTKGRRELETTIFIVFLSEKSSHTSMVSLKDMLDELDIETMLAIEKTDTE